MTGRAGRIILVLVCLAAVASPAAARSNEEIANLSGPDRAAILEAGARREGRLMFYTTLIVHQAVRPLKDAFEKKYPFVRLDYLRAGSSKLVQRLFAEHRAGRTSADVVVASAAPVMKQAAIAQAFSSPELAIYPRELLDPDRMWAPIRVSYNAIAYNTRLVPAADAPKTWEDLLDPRWKGRMVWAESTETGGPLLIAILRKAWGETRAMDYFNKLAAQGVHRGSGSIRSVLDQVIAGEFPVMVSAALHHVAISAAAGAPVAASSPSPLLGRNENVMMLKAAPHPHAAMLFIDFLLSKDGQTILRDARYLPARPDVEPLPEMRAVMPATTGAKVHVMSPEEHNAARKPAQDLFQKLFP
jgi:ABC-type Fe3+ transport system substrate-binding protein